MYQMFYCCESLQRIEIKNKDTGSSYLLDMSQLFYNCKKLETVTINFEYLYVSSSKEMFYNCKLLKSINYNPYRVTSNYIDMAKMFYGCNAIESITLYIYSNDYIDYHYRYHYYPNDMSYMFYNCKKLMALTI